MGFEEENTKSSLDGISDHSCILMPSQKSESPRSSGSSTDKDADILFCRVCHCAESDHRGDVALDFLDIAPPASQLQENKYARDSSGKLQDEVAPQDVSSKVPGRTSQLVEFVSPEGEVFVCSADVESSLCMHQDTLIDLGCSCKNELALTHYACALKWFVGHGSTICEICGSVAKNIRVEDFRKVMASLKDYETLRARTVTGELDYLHAEINSVVDPDALAAIRRQRLSEISLWFNPQNRLTTSLAAPPETVDQFSNEIPENDVSTERLASRRAFGYIGLSIASGILILILLWAFAPRVGKTTAKVGLYFLLVCLCILTIVIFLRFVLQSRFKYGRTRYWMAFCTFCFLAFGIWASRTHHARSK